MDAATKPICSTCNDTHTMTLHGPNGDVLRDREVPCTYCPTPCERCRQHLGAFCATTPCPCVCHADSYEYRGRGATTLPAIPAVELGSRAEVGRILKRAGVPVDCMVALLGEEKSTDPIARELRAVARLLVADAIAEDARWTERVKLLEGRIDFACDALRGRTP